jgi:universal stress protein E
MSAVQNRSLVVGSNLGTESDPVVAAALTLARRAKVPLVAIHAFEPAVPALAPFPAAEIGADTRWLEQLATNLRQSLANQGSRLGLTEAEGRVELILDEPERALATVAGDTQALAVVVGASTRPWAWRRLGTTADRLIRRCTRPVLMLAPNRPLPPTKAIFAVDLTPLSGGALASALEVLEAIDSLPGSLEALFVLDPAEQRGSLQFSPEQIERFAQEELARFLTTYAGTHAARINPRVVTGEPRDGLLGRLESEQPDLVVVGTHGRKGLDRLLLGSVATAVLDRVESHVLVIPPEAAQSALQSRAESVSCAIQA